jgi:hypothetical protein
MKLKTHIIIAVAALVSALRGLRLAGNTYDAAVPTHESAITRNNEVAITARHLLWRQGSGALGAALNDAATIPLGTIDNVTTSVGARQEVLLLGKSDTKKMVANGPIAAGARVFTAAGGKVSPTHGATFYQVGIALTAAGADNDVIEVADCSPIRTNA